MGWWRTRPRTPPRDHKFQKHHPGASGSALMTQSNIYLRQVTDRWSDEESEALEALHNFLKHHTLRKAWVNTSYVPSPIISILIASKSYMYHALVLTLAIQDTDSLGTVFSWSTDPDNHAICLTYQNIDVPAITYLFSIYFCLFANKWNLWDWLLSFKQIPWDSCK